VTYLITAKEIEQLLAHREQVTESVFSVPNVGQTLYKVLYNYVEKTAPAEQRRKLGKLSEATTIDTMKESLSELIVSIAEVASTITVETVKTYTTGQVSQMFGVSLTTINNWIQAGRIIGIHKLGKSKQARIPEDATWISSSNERMFIKEIADRFPNKSMLQRKPTPVEKVKAIMDDILFFEKKYGGCAYKDSILEQKVENGESMTFEEERDAQEWQYLLKRME
jgi:Helix-turn-helix domain